jgi:serine/threonine-protein kinase
VDPARARFDAAVLDRLTAALTEHLGPGACIAVAKAADHALDVYQLGVSLSAHVPVPHRARFLDGIGEVLRAGQAGALTPTALAQAARRLAEHIGPVARVLVDRESRAAASPADLYTRLAQHIRDPTARETFLASAPR